MEMYSLEIYKYILDEFTRKITLLEETVWEVSDCSLNSSATFHLWMFCWSQGQ